MSLNMYLQKKDSVTISIQTLMKYQRQKMSLQTSKLYSVLKEHSNEVGLPIMDNPTHEFHKWIAKNLTG